MFTHFVWACGPDHADRLVAGFFDFAAAEAYAVWRNATSDLDYRVAAR